ncbi:hypothetical protein D5086_032747 [Populus alba]|uniref:Uncharacterized protein n=1 Tax=Populus alba TaxID=43335 RepID=A0ACC4AEY2_POPAL
MGAKLVQLNNQRRSVIIEGIVSEFQREMTSSNIYTDIDSEEGAKIFKILETSAEREVLMAEMSPQQLASFASYQSKLEKEILITGSLTLGDKATGHGESNWESFTRCWLRGERSDREG